MYKAALISLRWRIVAKSFGVALLIITAGICVSYPANSQSKLRIAATVNDDMISILDIESRLSLSIYLSKLNNNQATRQRLAPQILRNIIDDRLKLQEIRKNKIIIQQAEIVRGIQQWEERSRLTKGGTTLLTQKLGIDKATIAEQVETQLGWIKLMRKLFLPSISFSEEEIEDIVISARKTRVFSI